MCQLNGRRCEHASWRCRPTRGPAPDQSKGKWGPGRKPVAQAPGQRPSPWQRATRPRWGGRGGAPEVLGRGTHDTTHQRCRVALDERRETGGRPFEISLSQIVCCFCILFVCFRTMFWFSNCVRFCHFLGGIQKMNFTAFKFWLDSIDSMHFSTTMFWCPTGFVNYVAKKCQQKGQTRNPFEIFFGMHQRTVVQKSQMEFWTENYNNYFKFISVRRSPVAAASTNIVLSNGDVNGALSLIGCGCGMFSMRSRWM